jgi:hypothetical protein
MTNKKFSDFPNANNASDPIPVGLQAGGNVQMGLSAIGRLIQSAVAQVINFTFGGNISAANLSGTNSGDQTISSTAGTIAVTGGPVNFNIEITGLPQSDSAWILGQGGATPLRWGGFVTDLFGGIAFDPGTGANPNYFLYTDAVGPKWRDRTTGWELRFNVQAFGATRTATWQNSSGTVAWLADIQRYTGTASGTNTYATTATPIPTAYSAGDLYIVTFTNANSGASTLNANTLGAVAIQYKGAALTGAEIPAGSTISLKYDGSAFQIVGVIGGGSSTSPTQWTVHQVAHGFVVGNVVHNGTSAWAKANNGTSTLTADAIVSAVAGADDFTVQQFGTLTLTTGQWDAVCGTTGGLTQGNYYWVDSTAGKMTATQPSGASNFQQVCITAMSTTYAEVLLPSDAVIGGGGTLITQQDGTNVSTTATTLNVQGPSVMSGAGATATLNIPNPALYLLGNIMP